MYLCLLQQGKEHGRKIQEGHKMRGLYYSDNFLFVVEWWEEESDKASYSLAVYRVNGNSDDITLLDHLDLETDECPGCPRVDRHSQRVFVPCHDNGVTVARMDGDSLVREGTLTCVSDAHSIDFMSSDVVYVCDRSISSVHVVDVRDDRITSTLEWPDTVWSDFSPTLAVLGDHVLVSSSVCYEHDTLVLYRHGTIEPVRVIPSPGGLWNVTAISTDHHHNFIVTGTNSKLYATETSLFVMGLSGELHHTLDDDSWNIVDCAFVDGKLWVGCENGDIVIRSLQ